jgi:hypothetical protein
MTKAPLPSRVHGRYQRILLAQVLLPLALVCFLAVPAWASSKPTNQTYLLRDGIEHRGYRRRWRSRSLAFQRLGSPGTASRRSFYGPGMENFDIALLKETHFSESNVLEVRLETFNTFNHAQFFGANSVDCNINSSTFGHVISAASPRLMQAALRFRF